MAGGGYELGDITGEDWGDALLIAAVVAGTAGVGAYAMAPAAAGAAGGGAAAAGGTAAAGGLGAEAGLGLGLGGMEAGLGGTAPFIGGATAGTAEGAFGAGMGGFFGGPVTEAGIGGGTLGTGSGAEGMTPWLDSFTAPGGGLSNMMSGAGDMMSTQNLQRGVMMGMLGQMGGNLFKGSPSQGVPPAATVPQIGRGQSAQPTALMQLAYLQAQQNARRNRPGMFG